MADGSPSGFDWADGERLIRFGELGEREILRTLDERGLTPYALLTGQHGAEARSALASKAAHVVAVPYGPVPEAAATVRESMQGKTQVSLVAFGGGRVIDSAKAIAGADRLRCAAIPTTLSGAEMTPFHRMPAGIDEFNFVRPELVFAVPSLMASQPMPDLAASAMNALAHAIEALYTPMTNSDAQRTALRAVKLIADGLTKEEPDRSALALGALLAGYASGVAGFAVHHAVCQTIVRIAGTPHAQTNAVMLAHFVRLVTPRAPQAIAKLTSALGDDGGSEAAADRVAALSARAGVTRLSELGVEHQILGDITAAALVHPALQNTPSPPAEQELQEVLEEAL